MVHCCFQEAKRSVDSQNSCVGTLTSAFPQVNSPFLDSSLTKALIPIKKHLSSTFIFSSAHEVSYSRGTFYDMGEG